MNELIEKMMEEFEKDWTSDGKGNGAFKKWLRTALISAYNAGLERAKEVAKRQESCGELEELGTCGHYHANESHVIDAIEKEKLTDSRA